MVEITKFRIKRRERKFILERLWEFENISSSFPIICQIVIIREMGVFFRCQRVNDLCRWTFKISGIFKLSFHFQKKKTAFGEAFRVSNSKERYASETDLRRGRKYLSRRVEKKRVLQGYRVFPSVVTFKRSRVISSFS